MRNGVSLGYGAHHVPHPEVPGRGAAGLEGRAAANPDSNYPMSWSWPPTGISGAVSFWQMTRSKPFGPFCHWPETSGVLVTFFTGTPVHSTGPTMVARLVEAIESMIDFESSRSAARFITSAITSN